MSSSGSDKLFPNQRGFPTPNTAPDTKACRVFSIPAQEDWLALAMGAMSALAKDYNWFRNGDLTPEEAAAAWQLIIDDAYALAETGECEPTVGTPYWDAETDVDAEAPTDAQAWYGSVSDPNAPASGLTFSEEILLWGFTGLVALSATPSAAIAFNTIAPKFIVAFRSKNIVEVIRVIVDNVEQIRMTTSGVANEDIRVPCYGDPSLTTHQVYVVKVS